MDAIPATLEDLWRAAGAPRFGDRPGRCRITGREDLGLPFADWVKDTFTDHDKLLPGEIVGNAALWSFDDRSATLARRLGEPPGERGPRMRNYSHFLTRQREWHPVSKGDKPRMLALLLAGPPFACVADSGQRHLLFRVRPGRWQFEEHSLPADAPGLRALSGRVRTALLAGFSKDEIGAGRYSHTRILAAGLPAWREIEASLRPARGTPLFALALFLTTTPKDES